MSSDYLADAARYMTAEADSLARPVQPEPTTLCQYGHHYILVGGDTIAGTYDLVCQRCAYCRTVRPQ